ncbi:MAG: hypothetical protein CMO12_03685 [Thaumarchaeota archaeon]|nr:hypothetical protein [Nitrososphaerota archaeon]
MSLTVKAMEIDQRKKYQILTYFAIIISIVTAGAFLYQSTNPYAVTDTFHVRVGKMTNFDFPVSERQAREGSSIEFQASGTNFGIQVLEPRRILDTKENINHYETTLVTDKAGFYRFTVFSTDLREGYVRGIWRSLSIPELGVGTGGMILVILLLVSLFSLLVSIYSFYQAKKLKNTGLSENTSGGV